MNKISHCPSGKLKIPADYSLEHLREQSGNTLGLASRAVSALPKSELGQLKAVGESDRANPCQGYRLLLYRLRSIELVAVNVVEYD